MNKRKTFISKIHDETFKKIEHYRKKCDEEKEKLEGDQDQHETERKKMIKQLK